MQAEIKVGEMCVYHFQVAEVSNRDPKEYVPLLNELRKVRASECIEMMYRPAMHDRSCDNFLLKFRIVGAHQGVV